MKDIIYSWPIQLEARKQAEEERKAAAAEAAEARNQAAAGAQAKKQAQVSAIIHGPPSYVSHFMPHRCKYIYQNSSQLEARKQAEEERKAAAEQKRLEAEQRKAELAAKKQAEVSTGTNLPCIFSSHGMH